MRDAILTYAIILAWTILPLAIADYSLRLAERRQRRQQAKAWRERQHRVSSQARR